MLTYRFFKRASKWLKEIIKPFKAMHRSAERKKKENLSKYIRKYIVKNANHKTIHNKKRDSLPVWQLWLQGWNNTPETIALCKESINKNIKEEEIIRLDKNNLFDYIDIPKFVTEKVASGVITHAHFSDIIRLELLHNHGGTWIDASVFMSAPLKKQIKETSLFVFSLPEYHMNYPFHLASSWFIHAKPKHPIIGSTLESIYNYWEHENSLIDYFLFHSMFSGTVRSTKYMRSIWANTDKGINTLPHQLQYYLIHADNPDPEIIKDILSNYNIHKLTQKNKKITNNLNLLKNNL